MSKRAPPPLAHLFAQGARAEKMEGWSWHPRGSFDREHSGRTDRRV